MNKHQNIGAIIFVIALLGGVIYAVLKIPIPKKDPNTEPEYIQRVLDLRKYKGAIIVDMTQGDAEVQRICFYRNDSIWTELFQRGLWTGYNEADTVKSYKQPSITLTGTITLNDSSSRLIYYNNLLNGK
jgi:hypothetical protein